MIREWLIIIFLQLAGGCYACLALKSFGGGIKTPRGGRSRKHIMIALGGLSILGLSLAIAVGVYGMSKGLPLFFALLSLAGIVVTLTNAFFSQSIKYIALSALGLALMYCWLKIK